ncbi:retrovirus-related pol polyprotein from transposon TNT 1-94 [Tanacetum coccineum]|uniref:Retrovirus-related pol polyprotein from transposon TNT 1-94 n=1 Tax=Tanacetum coccineum TaxID=301880 RepID=A0ABQ5J2H6_9ASTR
MASDHVSSDHVPQCPTMVLEQDNLCPDHQSQENVPQAAEIVTTSNELDLLFSLIIPDGTIKTTFLYSPLKEEVYVNQLDGFVDPYHPDQVYRLKKALYGLKKSTRAYVDDLLTYGCLDSRKSTSGGIQFLGWRTKLISQGLWLSLLLNTYVLSTSKAAIAISCNQVKLIIHTKLIDVHISLIKEQVEKGIVELFFVGTEYQLADLFTKALSEDRFKYLVRRLGMRCLSPEELEVLVNESA